MKYAFYISGKSGRLSKFLKQANQKVLDCIKVVVSDYYAESSIKELIKEKNIYLMEYDYESFPGITNKDKNLYFSNHLLGILEKESIDYCISFGSHILSGELLYKYKNRIINFHPAILPMFPGRKAIDQAVEHGNVFLLGNTAHFIDSGVDTGPIIMQSVTTMQSFSKGHDYDSILDLQIPMLTSIINAINNGDLIIQNGIVTIKNADYSINCIFPRYLD